MSRRFLPLIAILAAVFVAIVALYVFAFLASRDPGPGEKLDFPIVWTPLPPMADVPRSNSSVEIRADGSAEVRDLLVGQIASNEDRIACVEPSEEPYSGAATWDMSDGKLRIVADRSEALFFPSAARFGDRDWSVITEVLCDGGSVDYGAMTGYR